VIARLGGDEFIILFPHTDEVVGDILKKIEFWLLREMQKNDWAVTFSIGLATFNKTPENVDEAVLIVDNLMYSIKHSGKDGLRYGVY
jgi:diguanylate cyclase (GGDEF)-like protein